MVHLFQLKTTGAIPPGNDDGSREPYEDVGPDAGISGGLDEPEARQQQQQQYRRRDDLDQSMEGSGEEPVDLGRSRGVRSTPPPDGVASGSEPPGTPAKKLDVTISAECPEEIGVDREGILSIRLELTETTQPLARALPPVEIVDREDVDAIVSVDSLVLKIVGPSRRRLSLPSGGVAATDFFPLRGKRAGATRISVEFYQGVLSLGVLSSEPLCRRKFPAFNTHRPAVKRARPTLHTTTL